MIQLPPLTVNVENDAPDADLQSVLNGLLAYNRALEPESRYTQFAVFVRDEAGAVQGGLTGAFYFNALFIEFVWLAEALRGRGIGRALLRHAEAAAQAHGRDLVHLESMTFQSPGFYSAHGYSEYGRLEGYSGGAARVHLQRRLDVPAADAAAEAEESAVQAGLRLEVTTQPDTADVQTVHNGVMAWNAQVYQPDNFQPLNVMVRAPGGQVVGGLVGCTYWNACFIDLFWLDFSLRRQGIGSAVMRLAEAEAAARGCALIHLDTLNFQARGFYEKVGFSVHGALDGFVGDVERYHMGKPLTPANPQ